ncbi:hypothetical protein LINPERPRIM_LOCUS11381 [Linum perenne]
MDAVSSWLADQMKVQHQHLCALLVGAIGTSTGVKLKQMKLYVSTLHLIITLLVLLAVSNNIDCLVLRSLSSVEISVLMVRTNWVFSYKVF